jgi:hypothetical protein
MRNFFISGMGAAYVIESAQWSWLRPPCIVHLITNLEQHVPERGKTAI